MSKRTLIRRAVAQALSPRTLSLFAALRTGLLGTVSVYGLRNATYQKTGGDATISLASNGDVSTTTALTAGETRNITGKATSDQGVVVPISVNVVGLADSPIVTPVTAPAAPTVTLTAGDAQATIAWTDGSNGGAAITSHKLYRTTVSGQTTLLGVIPANSPSPYIDMGLSNGTTYFYRLSAVNSAGLESALSAEQSVLPTTGAVGSPTAGMKTGMGLTGVNTYLGYYPFANILWNGAEWQQISGSGNWSQHLGQLTPANTNDIFRMYISDRGVGLAPVATEYTVLNPSGAKIGFGSGGTTPDYTGWQTATQFTFTYTGINSYEEIPPESRNGLYMLAQGAVTSSNGAIRVIPTALLSAWNSGNIWNPKFLAFQQNLHPAALRGMDWFAVNFDVESEFTNNPTKNDITFWSQRFGGKSKVPLEVFLDLCNRLNADPWINVPMRASNAWLDAAANTCQTLLNPGLKVWLEFCNETWNGSFLTNWVWLRFLNAPSYTATPNGSGGWTRTNHGLSAGDKIVPFPSTDYMDKGYNAPYQLCSGLDLTVLAVQDANNFTTHYVDDNSVTHDVSDPRHTTLLYKKKTECVAAENAGGNDNGNANHGTLSLNAWSRFDAILGRSRVHHVMASQGAGAWQTTARLNVPGARAATDFVAIAPYYQGEWWVPVMDIASGQLTPRWWGGYADQQMYGAPVGTHGRVTVAAVYAAGSTPSLSDVLNGTGAGFIAKQSLLRTDPISNGVFAQGTPFTGLTNGTTYEVRFVFTDGYGNQWMASGTATVSATASWKRYDDGNANMALRAKLDVYNMLTATSGGIPDQVAAAGGIPLVCYEAASDYFGPNYAGSHPPEVEAYRAAYTQSPEAGDAYAFYYKMFAAYDFKLMNQFCDINAVPGVFNLAESMDDTSDLRYQFYASQNGLVPKVTPVSVADIFIPDIATEPSYRCCQSNCTGW